MINPREGGFQIQRTRGDGRGGFLLQTRTREEKARIMSDNKVLESGLTVIEPGRTKPKVMIYDVPTHIDKNDVVSCVWNQNLTDHMGHDDVVKSMKLVKTIKARDSKEHQVYETTAEVRNILLKEERIYIDYDRCRVKDFRNQML